mgnify:CR=1 FL=1
MDIQKIIKLLFWLHVGFTIIYSIEIHRMLFSPERPDDSPAKKNLKSEMVAKIIVGPEGTAVDLTVLRSGNSIP